jgi:hypothetical protein
MVRLKLTDTVRRLAWQEIHPAAQIPAKATFSVKTRTQESVKKVPQSLAGADKNSGQMLPELLLQGIAWVDRSSFQILRMRTDLLALKIQFGEVQPGFSEALAGLQTLVTFSEVQSPEVANCMWMPSEVDVHAQIGEAFGLPDAGYELYFDRWLRNVHHYTDYQPYRGPMSNNAEPEQSARRNDTEAHPYLEEPLKQLVKRIPDLKGIRPSADQQAPTRRLRSKD